jgi:molybdopterin synthase sulfur carrier subunit
METQIQVTCFAGLRKFFDRQLSIKMNLPTAYLSVIQELKKLNPEATEVLDNCRIAVHEKFVRRDEMKTTDEPIYLIPPSSGG